MNRKDFFKSMFGAAVVAAMPPIVVRQIEELPQNDVLTEVKHQIGGRRFQPNSVLYIFNDTDLIAFSNEFSLNMSKQLREVESGEWNEELQIWVPSPYKEYVAGPTSWFIHCGNTEWKKDYEEYFNKELNCLICYNEQRITGKLWLIEIIPILNASYRCFKHTYPCSFAGSGSLIQEKNEHPTA